jgi:hypothetical protein
MNIGGVVIMFPCVTDVAHEEIIAGTSSTRFTIHVVSVESATLTIERTLTVHTCTMTVLTYGAEIECGTRLTLKI